MPQQHDENVGQGLWKMIIMLASREKNSLHFAQDLSIKNDDDGCRNRAQAPHIICVIPFSCKEILKKKSLGVACFVVVMRQ